MAAVPLTVRVGHVARAHPWLVWTLTRVVGVVLACTTVVHGWNVGAEALAGDVVGPYLRAHTAMVTGHLPYRDVPFEYPPGALPFLYLPGPLALGEVGFLLTYVGQMLVLDAGVHRVLRRAGGPHAAAAADLWLYGGALTVGLLLCRNDLPACAAAVAGILALRAGRSIRGAVLLALGGLVKAWPAELLVALFGLGGRRIRAGVAAAGVLVAGLLPFAALGALPGMYRDLVVYHGSRGVEIEAVAALPQVLLAAVTGRAMQLSGDHSSVNLVHSAVLAHVCTAGGVLVACGAVAWLVMRRRHGSIAYPQLVLLATWLVGANLLVAKVLSPQYMLWLLAVAAVGVHAGVLDRLDQRLLLAAVLATTLEFPFDFFVLGHGGVAAVAPATFLLVRDVLLIWLVARWTRRLLSPGAERTVSARADGAGARASCSP